LSKFLSVLGSASLKVGVTEIDSAMKKIAKYVHHHYTHP
jgi:hypothetical protein